jgi:hypothetical protein
VAAAVGVAQDVNPADPGERVEDSLAGAGVLLQGVLDRFEDGGGELRRMRGGPVGFDDVRDVGRISGRFVELEGRGASDIEFVDRRDCCPTFGVELLDVRA